MMKYLTKGEEGFTLIELMVVVLIIAILLAIAIPTFLGMRVRAQDRAAQSNLRNALTAEKAFYTDNEVYTDSPTELEAIEPALTYAAASTTTPSVVGLNVVASTNSQVVQMQTESASGAGFCIRDDVRSGTGGTFYGTNAGGNFAADGSGCVDTSW